jgi:hypothetical protein
MHVILETNINILSHKVGTTLHKAVHATHVAITTSNMQRSLTPLIGLILVTQIWHVNMNVGTQSRKSKGVERLVGKGIPKHLAGVPLMIEMRLNKEQYEL